MLEKVTFDGFNLFQNVDGRLDLSEFFLNELYKSREPIPVIKAYK